MTFMKCKKTSQIWGSSSSKKNHGIRKNKKTRVFGLAEGALTDNAGGHHGHWRQPGGNGAWESVECISFWHKLIKALFLFANLVNDATFFFAVHQKRCKAAWHAVYECVWMCMNSYWPCHTIWYHVQNFCWLQSKTHSWSTLLSEVVWVV